MAGKKPRWENEMIGGRESNPKACETCMFRPSERNGVKLDRANTAHCGIYEYPQIKPPNVYWDGEQCEYYEKR